MIQIEEDNRTIKDLLREKNAMLDIELMKYVEPAENGCIDSQLELIDAFESGIGTKQDSELAAYIGRKLYKLTDDNRVKLGLLWNEALLERNRGNYDKMKEGFHQVINFMQKNMPMEEWDFSLFEDMEFYTQSEEK
jgi:hypothetical protein